jgi:hypothetical protein
MVDKSNLHMAISWQVISIIYQVSTLIICMTALSTITILSRILWWPLVQSRPPLSNSSLILNCVIVRAFWGYHLSTRCKPFTAPTRLCNCSGIGSSRALVSCIFSVSIIQCRHSSGRRRERSLARSPRKNAEQQIECLNTDAVLTGLRLLAMRGLMFAGDNSEKSGRIICSGYLRAKWHGRLEAGAEGENRLSYLYLSRNSY